MRRVKHRNSQVANTHRVRQNSFTLIELLVVIAIIAILASTIVASTSGARQQARDARRTQDLDQLKIALEMYYSYNNSYPYGEIGSNSEDGFCIEAAQTFQTTLQPYLATIPKDPLYNSSQCSSPLSVNCHCYIYKTNTNQKYKLFANIEQQNYKPAQQDGGTETAYYEVYAQTPGSNQIALYQGGGGGGFFVCGVSTVQDVEGNIYNTVQVGTQCWLKENMRTTKYPNGTSITKGPEAQGAAGWTTDSGYYSCPPNSSNNGEDCSATTVGSPGNLGLLYQWSAAMAGSTTEGAQGICPTGWHIPKDSEWYTLESYLATGTCTSGRTGWGECDPAGSKMAGNSTINWTSGTLTQSPYFNAAGLYILPSGYRSTNGNYYNRTIVTILWSSTPSGGNAWKRYLHYTHSDVYRSTNSKAYGFSVRCLKD